MARTVLEVGRQWWRYTDRIISGMINVSANVLIIEGKFISQRLTFIRT